MFCLESGIQLKETGIPLTIEMRNPSSTDKESGMQYLESPRLNCLGFPFKWGDFSNAEQLPAERYFGTVISLWYHIEVHIFGNVVMGS